MATFTIAGYAEFLRGYAQARLGPAKYERGRKIIWVEVTPHDDCSFTVTGHFAVKPEQKPDGKFLHPEIDLAPIHISRKDVEDNRAPEVLDERLPLWRAAADAPPLQVLPPSPKSG